MTAQKTARSPNLADLGEAEALQALAAYPLAASGVARLDSGLINRTFLARTAAAGEFVLQAVNPALTPESGADLHEDIEHLTAYLQQAGLLMPRLVRARDGKLFTRSAGHLWRLYNRIAGETRQTPGGAAAVESAAALLARVHAALALSDYMPRFSRRPAAHDTMRHVRRLRANLYGYRQHAEYAAVWPLANEILEVYQQLRPWPPTPLRLAHGDPKISNFIYRAGTDTALCLIDFDTFCRLMLPLEIGDALRSWCNPAGEDSAEGFFDRELALAALAGYAAHSADFITPREWYSLPAATEQICIELAARFCADALEEDYFAWDATRFPSRSRHNQVRARGQLNLARSLRRQVASLWPALEEKLGKELLDQIKSDL